ncbi:MAG: hypothetical protein M1823_003254 [Watsoniomyces obsoletus]|nr:MAG: hypothetical protein M1823_003254 [Watsoniomyces obsoletus]
MSNNKNNPPPPPSDHPLSPIEEAKRKAAYRAVQDHFNPSAHYIGIGSGSTVVYVVEAIAAMGPEVTSRMTFVPTGFQSRELIVEAGLPLGAIDSMVPLDVTSLTRGRGRGTDQAARRVANGLQDLGLNGERVMLDVVFDGADEVDEELNCIKGGGACLFQEKLVAISARKFVCVADFRKLQPRLLSKWPAIPIEIVPTSAPSVLRDLKLLGSTTPSLRLGGSAKAGPIITDNGNFIIDAPFLKPLRLGPDDIEDENSNTAESEGGEKKNELDKGWDVPTLAKKLKEIVGVVETGLFWGRNGIEVAEAASSSAAASSAAGSTSVGKQNVPVGGGQKPVAAYFGMEGGDVVVRTSEALKKKLLNEQEEKQQ